MLPVKGTRKLLGLEGSYLQKGGGGEVEAVISPSFKSFLQIQGLDAGQCRGQHNLYALRENLFSHLQNGILIGKMLLAMASLYDQ